MNWFLIIGTILYQGKFALPNLIVPSQAYEKAILKVAIYDPAAYGWGELERSTNDNFTANYKEIETIFDKRIN